MAIPLMADGLEAVILIAPPWYIANFECAVAGGKSVSATIKASSASTVALAPMAPLTIRAIVSSTSSMLCTNADRVGRYETSLS